MKTDEEIRTDMRILMLCGIVERLAELVLTDWAVQRDNEMKWVDETLHAIKVGMGDLKG